MTEAGLIAARFVHYAALALAFGGFAYGGFARGAITQELAGAMSRSMLAASSLAKAGSRITTMASVL